MAALVLFAPSPRGLSATSFTKSPDPVRSPISILWGVSMPLRTMRFLARRSTSAIGVRLGGYRLQMIRVNTMADPAKMVNLKSVRNRSDAELIRPAVSLNHFWSTAYEETSIAIGIGGAQPEPASIREFDLGKESLVGRAKDMRCTMWEHLGFILRGVMGPGVSAPRLLLIIPRGEV